MNSSEDLEITQEIDFDFSEYEFEDNSLMNDLAIDFDTPEEVEMSKEEEDENNE